MLACGMFFIIGGDGKEYGPVSADQVRAWIASGRANLDTRAKLSGTDEWRRLAEFPEFGGDAPPPLNPGAPFVPPALPVTGYSAPVAAPGEVPPASLWLRLGGALIDGFFVCLFSIPTILFFARGAAELVKGGQADPAEVSALVSSAFTKSLPSLTVLMLAQAVLISLRGQSIGKFIVGIRIVRTKTDAPAGFVRGFLLRSVVPAIIGYIPFIGTFFWLADTCFIFRDDRRTLHDLIADTKVIKK